MSREQFLNLHIVEQLTLRQSKNLTRLLLGHEATLDAQSLFRNLLAASVAELLRVCLVLLLAPVLPNFLETVALSDRPNVFDSWTFIIVHVGRPLLLR